MQLKEKKIKMDFIRVNLKNVGPLNFIFFQNFQNLSEIVVFNCRELITLVKSHDVEPILKSLLV